jgi:hypothetical protein
MSAYVWKEREIHVDPGVGAEEEGESEGDACEDAEVAALYDQPTLQEQRCHHT